MAFALGIAAVAVAVVAAGVSTYAAYEQAQSVTEANRVQSKALQQEADSARESAAFEERQFRRRIAILLGKQQNEISALGLEPSTGSPLLIHLDSVRQGEIEALNVRRVGAAAASAHEFEAALASRRASIAARGGMYAGIGGGLQGASSVLGFWAKAQAPSTTQTPVSPRGGDLSYAP